MSRLFQYFNVNTGCMTLITYSRRVSICGMSGFVIHRPVRPELLGWRVSHLASGAAVTGVEKTQSEAIQIAETMIADVASADGTSVEEVLNRALQKCEESKKRIQLRLGLEESE